MRRRLGVLATIAGSTALLTACDKPIPEITLQSGTTVTSVTAQTYCFELDPGTCHTRISGGVGALHVRRGSTILIDVPRDVAQNQWAAVSGELVSGTFRPITSTGTSSGLRRDTHTARVTVPEGNGTYLLQVFEVRGGRQTAAWVTRITVEQ